MRPIMHIDLFSHPNYIELALAMESNSSKNSTHRSSGPGFIKHITNISLRFSKPHNYIMSKQFRALSSTGGKDGIGMYTIPSAMLNCNTPCVVVQTSHTVKLLSKEIQSQLTPTQTDLVSIVVVVSCIWNVTLTVGC